MTVYRPDHKPWHDLLMEECTCAAAWADRGMVDDRCQYHRTIEVFEDYGFDGKTLWVRCPTGCDLGERDDGNSRWNCNTCGGMGFVHVWPEDTDVDAG